MALPPSTIYIVLSCLMISHNAVCSYQYWDHYNGVVTAATAQNMDDLELVLGPQFRLVIAAYWMYFTSSCDVIRERLYQETRNGRMAYFCQFVTKCPVLSVYQSCMIREVVINIKQACCQDPYLNRNMGGGGKQVTEAPYVTAPPVTATPISKGRMLLDQRTCTTGSVLPSRRIIGGASASRGEFPWVAMMVINGVFKCACTILDATHALTAAHCIDYLRGSERVEIIAGKHITDVNQTDPGQQRVYVSVYRGHNLYNRINAVNDIAILQLATPLMWSNTVQPVCLPPPGDVPADRCVVVGWGDTNQGDFVTTYPVVLQKVTLKTYSKNECIRTFGERSQNDLRNYVRDGTFCAANGLIGGKDSCKADSGGPLLCIKGTKTSLAYFQFGIVSNGYHCASPNDPGVYTDVTHYLDWIHNTVRAMS